MIEKPQFRLLKDGQFVRFQVVSDHHWKVVAASPGTGFVVGDEATPVRRISWQQAKRRVNGRRSSLSPNMLVLLRGEGSERSDGEVRRLLRFRPWDPDTPRGA